MMLGTMGSLCLTLFAILVSSVAGVTFTSPPSDATWAADGLHDMCWTYANTDPSTMDLYLLDLISGASTLLFSGQPVSAGCVAFSLALPSGDNYLIQATQTNNPSAILAQSPSFNIVAGNNPGASTIPAGDTVSVFSAPATGSFPVTTITNAVLTTSFPTFAEESISTASTLTTTTTEYSSLVNVTSTGTILIPITVSSSGDYPPSPSLSFPTFVLQIGTVPPVIPVARFKKWKRVADGSSIPAGAATISGTRGATTSSPTTTPSTVMGATTVVAVTTPTTTVTQPPVTVTLPPSYITLPPTIVTVTATARNNTVGSGAVVVVTSTSTPIITETAVVQTTTQPGGITSATTFYTVVSTSTQQSVPVETVIGTECAICTSGLINSGKRSRGEISVGRVVWWSVCIGGMIAGIFR